MPLDGVATPFEPVVVSFDASAEPFDGDFLPFDAVSGSFSAKGVRELEKVSTNGTDHVAARRNQAIPGIDSTRCPSMRFFAIFAAPCQAADDPEGMLPGRAGWLRRLFEQLARAVGSQRRLREQVVGNENQLLPAVMENHVEAGEDGPAQEARDVFPSL